MAEKNLSICQVTEKEREWKEGRKDKGRERERIVKKEEEKEREE